jgi:DNA-binding NarL/FixJ family response regulator
MPRKNGLEVLMAVKADPDFKYIPTLVYTSSVVKEDVKAAYDNYTNGYIKKSVDFDECIQIAKSINDFWFSTSVLYQP